jgi:uncharacterized caspase-like protein
LLDTCESGDSDEGASTQPTPASIKSRGLKRLGKNVPTLAERNRDRLIYVDLLRRSGATVLASSRGSEASFESNKLKHGLFTDAVLAALSSRAADINHDGVLDPRELLRFIAPRVAASSGDHQHPTLDRDNPAERIRLPSLW